MKQIGFLNLSIVTNIYQDFFKNINNKWFVLITLPKLNYFWRVYFDDNHIFIRTPNKYRNLFESFISKEDVKKYNVKSNINDITSTIMDKYKKKKN